MNKTTIIIGIGVIGLIGLACVGAVGWYLASPLFIDDVVNEEFPVAEVSSPAELEEVPAEEMEKVEVEAVEVAENMPDKEMDEPMPEMENAPVIIAQGQLQDADSFHQGSGSTTIYQLPDGQYVLRFEDFESTNGPDLHVLLAKHPTPTTREDVMQGYLDLGSLKGNIGNQNYEIPADVDISEYNSIVIYCMPFHVIFSTASLG